MILLASGKNNSRHDTEQYYKDYKAYLVCKKHYKANLKLAKQAMYENYIEGAPNK